jgi:hypothetical protein
MSMSITTHETAPTYHIHIISSFSHLISSDDALMIKLTNSSDNSVLQ